MEFRIMKNFNYGYSVVLYNTVGTPQIDVGERQTVEDCEELIINYKDKIQKAENVIYDKDNLYSVR